MDMEITLPEEIPVMTLPNVAFFPQALMPLFIFEPRYRQMLRDVLATNRLFAVAGIDPRQCGVLGQIDPPHRVATVGIVRACQKTDHGTSNLLIQGLCRIEIASIITDEPYRRIRVRALASLPGTNDDLVVLRRELARLLARTEPDADAILGEIVDAGTGVAVGRWTVAPPVLDRRRSPMVSPYVSSRPAVPSSCTNHSAASHQMIARPPIP